MNVRFFVPDARFRLSIQHLDMKNEEIFGYFPKTLQEEFEGLTLMGKETFSAIIQGRQVEDSLIVTLDGRIRIIDGEVAHPLELLRIEEIQGELSISGDLEQLGGEGDISIGQIWLESVRPDPIRESRAHFDWKMISPDSLAVENGTIQVTPLAVSGNFFFGMGQMTQSPRMYVSADLAFQSQDSVELIPDMVAVGSLSCHLDGSTLNPEKQWIRLTGTLNVDSLDVIGTGLFTMKGMNGRMPFQMDIDQLGMRLLPDSVYTPRPWVEYEQQRTVYQNLSPELGRVHIESIEVMGYHMNDLQMDTHVGRGYVQIPWFNVEILDGNVGGSLLINLGEGQVSELFYEIRAQASRINSAALADIRVEDEEETELNAALAFQGKGIDMTQDIDLEGFFHITKIGSKFASTLLQGLDPKGSDRSIRMTRRFLNSGWKPTLFSFELRHGYVYPSLVLSQPWFSPIRIPERLEYGRLPLAFFMKTETNAR